MNRNSLLKKVLLTLLAVIGMLQSHASGLSYVYIQGDKQIPFYVKFEDEMLPRYGKNYSIISELAPGPIHIQILFQQNVYPAQSFTIQIPEEGFRGFLLTKKGDAFSLYDIQQQFYLPAGNEIAQDRTPVDLPAGNYTAAITKAPSKNTTAAKPVAKKEILTVADVAKELEIIGEDEVPAKTIPAVKDKASPQFISDIELNNDKTQSAGTIPVDNAAFRNKVAIVNSDCPKALDNDLFEAILKKATDKSEKTRLKYLISKTEGNCYTTNQVSILTKTLSNDPEKYTFLKSAYSRITDQTKFPTLENLIRSDEWKSYFRLIIP